MTSEEIIYAKALAIAVAPLVLGPVLGAVAAGKGRRVLGAGVGLLGGSSWLPATYYTLTVRRARDKVANG